MYRKPKRSKFHLRDHIFFVFALLFLCASLLRTMPAISKLQQTVQTFLSGKLSFEETVQAVGSFPSTESQACFEAPQIESSLPLRRSPQLRRAFSRVILTHLFQAAMPSIRLRWQTLYVFPLLVCANTPFPASKSCIRA